MKWLIIFLGIVSNAFASVLIKVALTEPRKLPSLSEPMLAITNWPFWLGLLLYGSAFLLYVLALSKFPLNVAHPILTTGAVAVVYILSIVLLNEKFYWTKALGVLLVIIGVIFISSRSS
ncbi:MAG: EamA family transporter [Candidatus Cloacimonetes bacterium]|nr:EamA family transporter [Candidatus Cloacimonadota bacterium]